MGKIRVFLIDDHEIFRAGLHTVLGHAPDIEVAGESGTESGFLDRIESAEPDMVTIGISGEHSEVIGSVKDRFPDLKLLGLGTTDIDMVPGDARKLAGYVRKESSPDFLRASIKMISLGGTVWHPDLLKSFADTKTGTEPDSKVGARNSIELSVREKRLLSMLASGSTNKQISLELHLAQVTIKKALQALYIKIGATNRTQAAMKASRLGLN